ncbi:MAG: two-component regulator propeller domain-containing protein [Bacteroidota bacterium]
MIHRYHLHFYWFFLLLLFAGSQASAQPYRSEAIGLERGLSQSSIFAITQDQEGLLWLGTEDGLNRFNGYEFTVYKNEPFEPTSLGENLVTCLLADSKDRIWAGHRRNGVSIMSLPDSGFFTFSHDSDDSTSLSSNSISCFLEDQNANIWIGTSKGLTLVSNKQAHHRVLQFDHFLPVQDATNGLANYVSCVLEKDEEHLWVGTYTGLYIFNKETQAFSKVTNLPEAFQNQLFFCLTYDQKGRLAAGTSKGLLVQNSMGNWEAFFTEQLGKRPELHVSDIRLTRKGDLLVGTTGAGLFRRIFDPNTQQYLPEWEQFGKMARPGFQLASDHIRSLYIDRLNPDLLWIGHATNCLEKLLLRPSAFQNELLTDSLVAARVNTHYIGSVLQNQKGDIWMGTNNGLVRDNGTYRVFQRKRSKNPSYNANTVTDMEEAFDGSIWIGGYGGLDRFEPKEGGKGTFSHVDFKGRCHQPPVLSIHQGNDSVLYVGFRKGFNARNPASGAFWSCAIELDSILPDASPSIQLYTLFQDSRNRLWVGSSAGLLCYPPTNDPWNELQNLSPSFFKHDSKDPKSIRNDAILCINEGQDGTIWLGTFNGLIQVEEQNGDIRFHAYTEKDGLANNRVYGILFEDAGNALWMSTNNGISRFDLIKKTFTNFDSQDGLQGNEFNSQAYFKAKDGQMFFGGTNGYTRFYPNEVSLDTIPPKVLITSYALPGQPVRTLNQSGLTLPYRENSFTVNFNGLNYLNPESHQYAYRLEGLHRNYISCGFTRQVNFTNLPPGDYTLQVIASNADGIWSEQGDALRITIQPPFWQTLWFFALIAAIVALTLLGIHQYRIRAKVHRMTDLERVRKNAAADFHDELGHKLTVISLFGEIAKKKLENNDDASSQLDKIISHANSLYYGMKDLLWVLDPSKDSVYDLMLLLRDFGDELFDKTGVEFHAEGIRPNLKHFQLEMDQKRHIMLIFKESMNNSLKHASASQAKLTVTHGLHNLHIEFSDNGKGFNTEADLRGNGLPNLRSRAQKIDASLSILSSGKGTKVELDCPLIS